MVKHVEIVNAQGRVLRGYYTEPENFNGDVVVMLHGFTGNKTEHAGHFRNFSRILAENSVASLRMDFSGNGESDGEFRDFTYDTMIAEALQMIDYARSVKGFKRLFLLGFSMGGAIAANISGIVPEKIDKLILWAPAGMMPDEIKEMFETGEKLENGNAIHANYEISKEMYESAFRWHTYENLDKFENNVLIIQGRSDKSVPYLYAARYAVSFKNSHLYIVDDAGHGFDPMEHRQKLYDYSLKFVRN